MKLFNAIAAATAVAGSFIVLPGVKAIPTAQRANDVFLDCTMTRSDGTSYRALAQMRTNTNFGTVTYPDNKSNSKARKVRVVWRGNTVGFAEPGFSNSLASRTNAALINLSTGKALFTTKFNIGGDETTYETNGLCSVS